MLTQLASVPEGALEAELAEACSSGIYLPSAASNEPSPSPGEMAQ